MNTNMKENIMVFVKTNFTSHLLLLLRGLNVITTASAENSENNGNQNRLKLKPISNKKRWIEMYQAENNLGGFKNNNSGLHRPWEDKTVSSTLLKTDPAVPLATNEEIEMNKIIVPGISLLNLSTKHKLNEHSEFVGNPTTIQEMDGFQTNKKSYHGTTQTNIHGSPKSSIVSSRSVDNDSSVVFRYTHGRFKYTATKSFKTNFCILEKRSVKDTKSDLKHAQEELSCQNPSSSLQDVRQIIKKVKFE